MRKQDWLGVLHVGHASHGNAEFCLCLRQKRIAKREQAEFHLRSSVHDEEAEIGGDEFVTASASVKFPAERAEFFDKGFSTKW